MSCCFQGHCTGLHKIDVDMVKNGIKMVKQGKKDENYDLNTNHLIKGPDVLHIYLAIIFNAMLIHGCCDKLFYKSVIRPIPKNKRNH